MSNTDSRKRASSLEDDLSELSKVLFRGAPPDQRAEWLRVPLEHAAAEGSFEVFSALIGAGAKVGAGFRGREGRTLFDAAARGGNAAIVSGLLRRGALPDLNVVSDCSGRSALYLATCLGHEEAARSLVVAGADVNFRDPADQCDVLFKAVQGGLEELVGVLVAAGASPNTRGEGGGTPLHIAAGAGSDGMVTTLLVRGAEKDALDDEGSTPLFKAAHNGHSGVVDTLMAAGADADIEGGEWGTPAILQAVCEGHVGVLEVLANYGVDLTAVAGRWKCTPLIILAARVNQAGVIEYLIEAGVDIESKAQGGSTPLLNAASRCSLEAIRTLLSHGAAIHAETSSYDDDTPLHVACRFKCKGMAAAVDLMLRNGADEAALNGKHTWEILASRLPISSKDEYMQTLTQVLDKMDNWSEEDEDDCSLEEIERARLLLARAPNDRAWRRRSWLVMLRSRASKAGEEGPAAGREAKAPRLENATRVETGLGAVVASLVGLKPEGVFRNVLGFL